MIKINTTLTLYFFLIFTLFNCQRLSKIQVKNSCWENIGKKTVKEAGKESRKTINHTITQLKPVIKSTIEEGEKSSMKIVYAIGGETNDLVHTTGDKFNTVGHDLLGKVDTILEDRLDQVDIILKEKTQKIDEITYNRCKTFTKTALVLGCCALLCIGTLGGAIIYFSVQSNSPQQIVRTYSPSVAPSNLLTPAPFYNSTNIPVYNQSHQQPHNHSSIETTTTPYSTQNDDLHTRNESSEPCTFYINNRCITRRQLQDTFNLGGTYELKAGKLRACTKEKIENETVCLMAATKKQTQSVCNQFKQSGKVYSPYTKGTGKSNWKDIAFSIGSYLTCGLLTGIGGYFHGINPTKLVITLMGKEKATSLEENEKKLLDQFIRKGQQSKENKITIWLLDNTGKKIGKKEQRFEIPTSIQPSQVDTQGFGIELGNIRDMVNIGLKESLINIDELALPKPAREMDLVDKISFDVTIGDITLKYEAVTPTVI